jgi:hypothetical protein
MAITTDLGATAATARSARDSGDSKTIVSPGDTIGGRYVVEEVLGSGGMGVVVAARHEALGHRVAMKFVSPSAAADAEAYARFSREARIIASLESDHVVRVTDFGIHAGSPYMVMDLLAGRDLGGELRQRGPLPPSEAVDYLIQACDGLWSTHVKGIVHRDVKLANLFLATRADGERVIKVLDFGVSKPQAEVHEDVSLTRTATMIGSPLYMSPEQIRDPRLVDERADVWSLGIVLHKLLTDQVPFSGQSTNAVCAAIAADPPTPLRSHAPRLPSELEAVVLRCLEKRPERRYPSVAALARDLAPFASEAGAALARQLVARAIDDDPRVAALESVASAPADSESRPRALRSGRVAAWVCLVALAVAGSAGVWLRHPWSASTAIAPTTAPAVTAIPVPPDTAAVAEPLASARTVAADAPVPATSEPEHRRLDHRRAAPSAAPRVSPLPAPRAASSSTSRFGGSALDDHQ